MQLVHVRIHLLSYLKQGQFSIPEIWEAFRTSESPEELRSSVMQAVRNRGLPLYEEELSLYFNHLGIIEEEKFQLPPFSEEDFRVVCFQVWQAHLELEGKTKRPELLDTWEEFIRDMVRIWHDAFHTNEKTMRPFSERYLALTLVGPPRWYTDPT